MTPLIEFEFHPEHWLPGSLLIQVVHQGKELACTVVAKTTWTDPVKRKKLMDQVGGHLYHQYLKPLEDRL